MRAILISPRNVPQPIRHNYAANVIAEPEVAKVKYLRGNGEPFVSTAAGYAAEKY